MSTYNNHSAELFLGAIIILLSILVKAAREFPLLLPELQSASPGVGMIPESINSFKRPECNRYRIIAPIYQME